VLTREPSHAFDGYWRSDGYNWIVDIHAGQVTIYDATEISCFNVFEASLYALGSETLFDSLYGHERLSLTEDKLVFSTPAQVYISHSKIPDLPPLCSNGGTAKTQDPVFNFEIFWHAFQENYPFFDVRGVDWQNQYDVFRPQVKADMSQAELFRLMSDMIAPINDGHVSLYNPETNQEYFPGKKPDWANRTNWMTDTLIDTYLRRDQNVKLTGNTKLLYGKLNNTIGYLNVFSMEGFNPEEEDDPLAAAEAMDQALKDIGDVKAMIVDVRFNGGGSEDIAMALASRFADQRRLAYSVKAKEGNGFTPAHEFYLEPGGESQFTKPVFLLTSNLTMSAAENFVLLLRVLPHVTVIGEKTRGCFSLILRGLPNGWFYGLANQVYTAADGKVYEGIGIPPSVEVDINPSGFQDNKDAILDKALELAGAIR